MNTNTWTFYLAGIFSIFTGYTTLYIAINKPDIILVPWVGLLWFSSTTFGAFYYKRFHEKDGDS